MSKEIGFSVSEEIRNFIDYYADQHGTTSSAMAKRGLFAEVKRHPLKPSQVAEYEAKYGEVPSAFGHTRPVPFGASFLSSPNSSQEGKEAKKEFSKGVLLSDSEHEKLVKEYGPKNTAAAIAKLSAFKLAKGKAYKSDYGAILSWAMRSVLEKGGGVPEPTVAQACPECHIGGGNHALSCSRHHENSGRPA